ncbi:hypothetical protein AHAS_Ahas06G0020600 [Arachis hypogaea]
MPTSNQFECTMNGAIMIYCIMNGEEMEVEDIIAQQIYSIVSNSSTHARVGFPHLIYHLCEAARVKVKNDFSIPVERPITKKTMEYVKGYQRVHRGEQAREEA